MVWDDKSG
uniref:Uncharacterized protein n=1 Tax=Rhizophora mucronata TaxID=61149 RepID=A0A2P2IQF6_RHIMU